jgi:type II secretory pathway component PulF
MEKYFTTQQKLRREFVKRITWPVIQLILAILTVSGLILILDMLPPPEQGQPRYDPLGLGLFGVKGAAIFLGAVLAIAAAVTAGWWLLRRTLGTRTWLDSVLLGIPVLGPCLRTLAMARFCLALRLTTETSLSIVKAVGLSMRATGNNAFIGAIGKAQTGLRSGQELTASLSACDVFPEDFLLVMAVAEESGRLNEVLRHQGEHYDEESVRRLSTLTSLAGYGVWMLIGLVLIFTIFRLFSSYLSQLNGI